MTGCVLAGGRSTRMGRDKARIELGGRTLAARAVERLRGIFAHVIAATSDPEAFAGLGVPTVPDRLGAGPLAGVAAALAAAPTEHVFCCAVDMPFVSGTLVRYLCSLAPEFDIVVPRGAGASSGRAAGAGAARDGPERSSPLEPLHAVYRKGCLPRFEERLRAGRLKVDAAFEGLRVRVVEPGEVAALDPAGRSFWNVNTPEDLARALRDVV